MKFERPGNRLMFDRFVGIDWSGAKGPRQAGIQLSMARPGRGTPTRIESPTGHLWGRQAVFEWLLRAADAGVAAGTGLDPDADSGPVSGPDSGTGTDWSDAAGGSILVGIDFAFAHPFSDENAYYPGLAGAPETPAALWQNVADICKNDAHLYGGAMFGAPGFGDYYLSPRNHGAPHYRSRRRVAELAAKASARAPSPTFKAIGADNVATGSMAGMRLIHALKAELGDALAVWPFEKVSPARLPAMVLVEIFPSYYFHAAGLNPARNAAVDPGFMTAALNAWSSNGVGADYAPRGSDADEADAMISAAALRHIAGTSGCWHAPADALMEGWIFGVPG
jgi:hypothetical protein